MDLSPKPHLWLWVVTDRAHSLTQAAKNVLDEKLSNPGGAQSRAVATVPHREEPDEVSS